MRNFTGKSEKINGVWYPVSVKAENLKEANSMLKKGMRKSYGIVEAIKGRFEESLY
jgi:hypothetical protein